MLLLNGLIIGIFISFPIGPLGLLSLQRTITNGWKTGFFSAVGTATSDLVYSSLAILGISFIDDFVNKHIYIINGLTGILFLIVGINIVSSNVSSPKVKGETSVDKVPPFFVHFFIGLSNPMTFLLFFSIFTKIGIYVDNKTLLQHILFVISILAGSSIQWLITTNLIDKSNKNYKFENFIFIDKIIGIVVIIFGVFSIIKGITRF